MKKVLVVDDSRTMVMSIEGVLKRAGFIVETARDGNQAMGKINSFEPDLMITDLNMPGMDGMTLIKQAKSTPVMRFKPILMLTAESEAKKRNQAKALGATGWLVKPIQPIELLKVVKQVI